MPQHTQTIAHFQLSGNSLEKAPNRGVMVHKSFGYIVYPAKMYSSESNNAHSFTSVSIYLDQGCSEYGAYPGYTGQEARIYAGWDANPLQDTTHTYGYTSFYHFYKSNTQCYKQLHSFTWKHNSASVQLLVICISKTT